MSFLLNWYKPAFGFCLSSFVTAIKRLNVLEVKVPLIFWSWKNSLSLIFGSKELLFPHVASEKEDPCINAEKRFGVYTLTFILWCHRQSERKVVVQRCLERRGFFLLVTWRMEGRSLPTTITTPWSLSTDAASQAAKVYSGESLVSDTFFVPSCPLTCMIKWLLKLGALNNTM